MVVPVNGRRVDRESVLTRSQRQRRRWHADLAHIASADLANVIDVLRLHRRDDVAVGAQCHFLVLRLGHACHRESDFGRSRQGERPTGRAALCVGVGATTFCVIFNVETDH